MLTIWNYARTTYFQLVCYGTIWYTYIWQKQMFRSDSKAFLSVTDLASVIFLSFHSAFAQPCKTVYNRSLDFFNEKVVHLLSSLYMYYILQRCFFKKAKQGNLYRTFTLYFDCICLSIIWVFVWNAGCRYVVAYFCNIETITWNEVSVKVHLLYANKYFTSVVEIFFLFIHLFSASTEKKNHLFCCRMKWTKNTFIKN